MRVGSHAAYIVGLWRVRAAASGDMRGVIDLPAHEALHRALGITYCAAWFMAHRIRRALAPESFNAPLGGTVEADETP